MFDQVMGSATVPLAEEGAVLSVSCPGGIARQFRVQVASDQSPSGWTLAGSFRDRRLAQELLSELVHAGRPARIVCCRTLPTA